MATAIKIRLQRHRLEYLTKLLRELLAGFEATDAHEVLLREHLAAFVAITKKQSDKKQWNNTLKLSAVECVAWCLLAQWVDAAADVYGGEIVQGIVNTIHKEQTDLLHSLEVEAGVRTHFLKQLK